MMKNNIIPLYDSHNLMIDKSKDCYVFDSNGKRYLDLEAGVWCTNIGHSNSYLNEIITDQIKLNIHHGYKFKNKYAESLSDKILEISEIKNGQSVFLSSGSEAIEFAIAVAKQIRKKDKILKISSSYLSAFGQGKESADNFGLERILINDINSIPKINIEEIAALVLEVGNASFDVVRFPDKEFLDVLVSYAKRAECILICDEVTTGIGRTGKWFGFQHYDFIPDILVCGKGLGNGYPISSVTINQNISEELIKNPLRYAQSHQNDSLGCAVGCGVLDYIIVNDLIDYCEHTGKYFLSELSNLQKNNPGKIKEVRGKGLILSIEFYNDVDSKIIYHDLLEAGFLLGYKNNSFRFLPSLTIKKNDIDDFIKCLGLLL